MVLLYEKYLVIKNYVIGMIRFFHYFTTYFDNFTLNIILRLNGGYFLNGLRTIIYLDL